MIYAGISSLSTVSGTLIIENYGLHGNSFYVLIHWIVTVDYIYAVGLSIFLIIFFILKIIKKSVDLNYKISIWGAVFPFGVLSSATYLTYVYGLDMLSINPLMYPIEYILPEYEYPGTNSLSPSRVGVWSTLIMPL